MVATYQDELVASISQYQNVEIFLEFNFLRIDVLHIRTK